MAGTCLKAEAQLANALQPMQYLEAQIRQLSAKHFGHSSQKTNKKAEPFVKEPELLPFQHIKEIDQKLKKQSS